MIMFECESGTVVEMTELETPCWVGVPLAPVVCSLLSAVVALKEVSSPRFPEALALAEASPSLLPAALALAQVSLPATLPEVQKGL